MVFGFGTFSDTSQGRTFILKAYLRIATLTVSRTAPRNRHALMVLGFLTRTARHGNALAIRAFLCITALSIGRTATRNRHALMVLGFLTRTARHGYALVARTSLCTAALAVSRTAARNRLAFMVFDGLTSATRHGNTLVARTSLRTAALAVIRTTSRNRHALVVLGCLASTARNGNALVARTSFRTAALAVSRATSRNRHALVVLGCLASTARHGNALVVRTSLRRTTIGIFGTIAGDFFTLGTAAGSRLAQRRSVRTPCRRSAVSRRAIFFNAFVLRIAPAVARRTRRRNTASVHRFITRFASRASRCGTRRAVFELSGTRFARCSVRIEPALTGVAAVATVSPAQTGRTIRRSADASAGRRKRTARFTAAFAVSDLPVRTRRTRRVVRARFA